MKLGCIIYGQFDDALMHLGSAILIYFLYVEITKLTT